MGDTLILVYSIVKKEYSLIGKIGSFKLHILSSSLSTLVL